MIRLRTLRDLGHARRRLRDAAARAFAVAEADARAATARREAIEAARAQLLDATPARLRAAHHRNELLLAEAEREAAGRLLVEAEQARCAAVRVSEDHRKALARRESDLRVAEHLIERALIEREQDAQRDEQHATDDLTAARLRSDA